jgi:hypothetical protein
LLQKSQVKIIERVGWAKSGDSQWLIRSLSFYDSTAHSHRDERRASSSGERKLIGYSCMTTIETDLFFQGSRPLPIVFEAQIFQTIKFL